MTSVLTARHSIRQPEMGADLSQEAQSLFDFLADVRRHVSDAGQPLWTVRIESDMPQGDVATYATLWSERLSDGSVVYDVRLTST